MIELMQGLSHGQLEFRARGTVTAEDYRKVLMPAVDEIVERDGRVRVLAHFGPDFEGYALGALVDDAKLGLRHWSGFERVAVVSDVPWLRHVVAGLAFALPCPVQVFRDARLGDARRWLRESLGSARLEFDDAHDVVTVQLLGRLEPEAYGHLAADLDGWAAGRERVRLLLDLREFDGWQGLGALHEHLRLVRDHRHLPERVAVVAAAAWQRLASRVVGLFLDAQLRWFEPQDMDAAGRWLREG